MEKLTFKVNEETIVISHEYTKSQAFERLVKIFQIWAVAEPETIELLKFLWIWDLLSKEGSYSLK